MKIGFIGCGNMAKAIISGILKNQLTEKENIIASDISQASREISQRQLGINMTVSNLEVVENSDVLFLAVKPQYYESVISEIRDAVRDDLIIVTIAPGKTLQWLGEKFEKDVKIVRCMPNTPALVGEGMTAATPNAFVKKEELELIVSILNSFGKTEIIGEYLMDAVVSVSGSSPAYVYMMIEAMADGAVADGMPRDMAYKFAAQAVLGSAKMVLESGKHPGELKDMVCSPAGTTIEAVRTLEKEGFRSSIMEAMKVCTAKAKGM